MARFLVVVSLSLCFCLSAFTQNLGVVKAQDQPTKDASAIQLLVSMNAACGWNAAAPANVLATGTSTTPDGKSEPVILKAKPGWLRIERPQSNVIVIVSDTMGEIVTNGQIRFLSGAEATAIQPLVFPFYTQLGNPNASNLSLALGTPRTVAGAATQVVNVFSISSRGDGRDSLRQSASKMSVAISTANSQPLGIRVRRISRDIQDVNTDVDTFLADYRSVGGVLVPFRYIEGTPNEVFFTWQFHSGAFNASIADSDCNFIRTSSN
jgi:hypothetical protein